MSTTPENDPNHGVAIFIAALIAAGYTMVYFLVRKEIPDGGGWAVLVSALVAVNLVAAATSIE